MSFHWRSRRIAANFLSPLLVEPLETRILLTTAPPTPVSPPDYLSRDCSISGVPGVVMAGQTFTMSFTIYDMSINTIDVGCSEAGDNVLVDGKKEVANAGYPGLYDFDYPAPEPTGGAGVSVPINGRASHSVTFEIPYNASTDFNTLDAYGYSGPWVTCSGTSVQGFFSSSVPFQIQGLGDLLKLQVRASSSGGKQAKPGDTITYSINPLPKAPLSELDLEAEVPNGTTLVAGSAGSGTVDGSSITWDTTGSETFSVTVNSAENLSGITEIDESVLAGATFTDGTTAQAGATVTTPLLSPTSVRGTLYDVLFQYPSSLTVNTTHPLTGVLAELVDSSGSVVDSVKTNGAGKFSLDPKVPGSYELEFIFPVDRYQSGNNAIDSANEYIGQSVDVPVGSNAPIELGNLYAPRTFLNTSAKILQSLNNFNVYGFRGVLGEYSLDLFQFNTTSAEDTIATLLGTSSAPTAFMPAGALQAGGSTSMNSWVSAIRAMAGLSVIQSRATDTVSLVDTAGKSLALLITANLTGLIGKQIGSLNKLVYGKSPQSAAALAAITQAKSAKVTRMSIFTALGTALPLVINNISNSGTLGTFLNTYVPGGKAALTTIIMSFLRYATDFFTGTLADDLIFEAAYNFIRLSLDGVLLNVLTGMAFRTDAFSGAGVTGGSGNSSVYQFIPTLVNGIDSGLNGVFGTAGDFRLQATLNLLLTQGYDPTTGTAQALTAMNDLNDNLGSWASAFQLSAITAGAVQRALRELDGVFQVNGQVVSNQIIEKEGGLAYVGNAFRLETQIALTDLNNIAQTVGGLKQASILSMLGVLVASSIGGLAESIWVFNNLPLAAAKSTISPPINATVAPSAELTAVGGSPATGSGSASVPGNGERVEAPALAPLAAAGPSADATAYDAVLTQISSDVKANNPTAVAALFPQLQSVDTALFSNDLIPAANLVMGDTEGLNDSQQQTVSLFYEQVSAANTQSLISMEQLQLWLSDPNSANAAYVVKQNASTITSINSASEQSSAAQAAISGISAPAVLVIDETSIPQSMTVGDNDAFEFTVTNIGNQSSVAGTLALNIENGGLVIQGSTTQDVPVLTAGQSMQFTWQVQAASSSGNGDLGPSLQVLLSAGGQIADAEDEVDVIAATTPPAFGSLNNKANVPLTATTTAGATITYHLSGPGIAVVTQDSSGNPILTLNQTTSASNLSISVTGAAGATIDSIISNQPLGSIVAPAITLAGELVVPGNCNSISLAGIDNGSISLGGTSVTSLQLGSVTNASINSSDPISRLSVSNWTNNDGSDLVQAPSLQTLSSAGNFGPELQIKSAMSRTSILGNVTGAWYLDGKLGTLSVGGNFSGILTATGIESITIKGDLDNSTILAGVIANAAGLEQGDTFDRGSIGSLDVVGSINSSLIAAGLFSENDQPSLSLNASEDELLSGSSIGSLLVGNSISSDSRILASQLPAVVKVGSTKVTTANNSNFSL